MTLILYVTIFHVVAHLTAPKSFLVAQLLFNLFDDKVLYHDSNS